MKLNETLIQKHIKTLGITREEAIQLIADDEAVDKMTMKQINAEMTDEQKKAIKDATKVGARKATVYKFDTTKRKRAENLGKRALIDTIKNALEGAECERIEVTNVEREIVFYVGETKYKIVLSAPRS